MLCGLALLSSIFVFPILRGNFKYVHDSLDNICAVSNMFLNHKASILLSESPPTNSLFLFKVSWYSYINCPTHHPKTNIPSLLHLSTVLSLLSCVSIIRFCLLQLLLFPQYLFLLPSGANFYITTWSFFYSCFVLELSPALKTFPYQLDTISLFFHSVITHDKLHCFSALVKV